ncbi:winged helix-turn-helix transcriptional regulator [Ensifer sp. 4252]|uniref:winged helix-turn-helix transcriptional regulator n=1 Tax=Ensifer sp. 4252 TaxID=3373915 RepID=UPI003D21222B
MLFRKAILDQIAKGGVTLAFRRWTKPTVKAGGSLRTAAGILSIDAIETTDDEDISAEDARRAGFPTREALFAELDGRSEGTLYRITFHRSGDDPRLALRDDAALGKADRAAIAARLARFDETAGQIWAEPTLRLIASRDGITAAEIAERVGMDKFKLKARIRKLKELGLTESLTVGYRLSPRGRSFLGQI